MLISYREDTVPDVWFAAQLQASWRRDPLEATSFAVAWDHFTVTAMLGNDGGTFGGWCGIFNSIWGGCIMLGGNCGTFGAKKQHVRRHVKGLVRHALGWMQNVKRLLRRKGRWRYVEWWWLRRLRHIRAVAAVSALLKNFAAASCPLFVPANTFVTITALTVDRLERRRKAAAHFHAFAPQCYYIKKPSPMLHHKCEALRQTSQRISKLLESRACQMHRRKSLCVISRVHPFDASLIDVIQNGTRATSRTNDWQKDWFLRISKLQKKFARKFND